MTTPARMYDPKEMAQISKFFSGLVDLMEEFEGGDIGGPLSKDNPLYIYGMEIVIRHRDEYTIGRISIDDFPFFELTDEKYVSAVEEALKAHIRQEDTATGQYR